MSTQFSHVLKASVAGNTRKEIIKNLLSLINHLENDAPISNCRDLDWDYDIVKIPDGGDFAGVDCSKYKMADKF